ncbi:nucleoside deaminase [Mumia zhuanghuii]|uniref:Nucleoside deaminase n=1 Tax=Mumia zhuanghuii TaxID=2585211 RepID=A0A5C4MVN7_9ACTN|nr:nucleoside deaminase [Mumia zhuanghuii]TNC49051.1 nucleoside deaminase [Mumia zhuanghuii]TNC49065.1 nucleoside deaminase [Mumia zhuanghuii]
MSTLSPDDLGHLHRSVTLAATALAEGNQPFGSVLVDAAGHVLREDHNRDGRGDRTRHPELALAQWASAQLSPEVRAGATVYTSGEHCAMCAGAHAWAGLGRIVFVVPASRLAELLHLWGAPPSPVAPLAITTVAPHLPVEGPVPALATDVEALYERCFRPA